MRVNKMIKTLKMPTLDGKSIEEKRATIKRYFNNSWAQYQSLFSLINNDEAFYIKAEPLRHPLVFYFGHTATFYINKLLLGKFITQRIDPHLEAICAVGVDEMSWDDLNSENYNWPSIDHIRHYRQQVHTLIENIIDTMEITLPIAQDSLAWIILMGIEHERIHIETSSVIIRQLALEHLTDNQQWPSCESYQQAPKNCLIAQAGSSIKLGKPNSDKTYGWDNEYGEQLTQVTPFGASKFLVSNQEYLAFVKDRGYQKPAYWTEEGKNWLSYTHAQMPRFWRFKHGEYFQRNLLKLIPLPLNWPVEVNYLEAKAFCQWKSEQDNSFIRLPTEAEWQLMREKIQDDVPSWQSKAPGNINLSHFASPCPVDTFKHDDLYDVIGNVWQWNESAIDGFTGFSVHPLYDDFSTPTFDGKHNLIKGGSWISTGNEALKHARYAFRRHFYQHAGFRYIRAASNHVPIHPVQPYELDSSIANKIALHYQGGFEGFASPINQAITFIKANFEHITAGRALDLGCSVGGASFALAQLFEQVDGIDLTARHIQHALALKAQGTLRYALPMEGELVDYQEFSLSSSEYHNVAEKVNFYQGDALNLKPQFSHYDFIYCGHLLDALIRPKELLNLLAQKLNNKGVLAIVTQYQLNEQSQMIENGLGGFKMNGENVTGQEGLTKALTKDFTQISLDNFSWLKRVNARRYIFNKSEISLWQKK